jgi:PPOX class probable F420-dependent enzyme
VWNVRHREGWACTTDPSSGKVRRIRRDPRVEVAPCDARGRTAPGAPRFTGTARVVAGGEHEEVRAAIRRRHRILGPLLGLRDSLQRLLGRPVGECAVTWTVEG